MGQSRSKEAQEIVKQGAPADAAIEAGLPTAAEKEAAASQKEQRSPRLRASDLLADPTLLGEEAHVIAGAFHDAEIDSDAELTEAEAMEAVEKFRRRAADNSGQEG